MTPLKFADLEAFYDELATAIDVVGSENESVFLAKLVLSVAQEFGNAERLSALLADCLKAPDTSLLPGTRVI
jgi:hypothetical protein